jgi:Flp pilus assembly protein TadD
VAAHQKGDLEVAVQSYRAALAASPRHPQVLSNLGAALAALGRYQEAIEAYREALEVAPDPRIRTNLALAYYKSADLPRAAEELAAVHAAQPQDLRVSLLLADCRLQMGEHDSVVRLLRPLEAEHGEDRTLQYLLAMAAVRGGNTAEASRRIDRLLQGGDSAEAQYLLGSASFMGKDYPKAVGHFAKALAQNPALPSLRSYYGQALLFTGDPEAAAAAFRAALEAAPNDYAAAYYLASILENRGQREQARPLAARALQLRPLAAEARELAARLERPAEAPRSAQPDSPLVGKPAPEAALRRLDGSAVTVSSLRGRPQLLAFGSFTCPQFRHGAPVLNRLHERYRGQIDFRMVYIREAHPEGDWQSTINQREGVSLPEARDERQRGEHAGLCRTRLSIPYEALLDTMDGAAERAFMAFPSRAFVLDAAGRVVYSTALDEESLREQALDEALAQVAR